LSRAGLEGPACHSLSGPSTAASYPGTIDKVVFDLK
jgi:hypothetical protein